ncbi:hypothetical protein ZWY2020_041749 [Hordeum vulgare]|nr:hypothetical protein ZWY2020_041749 [Hordeum vulgare]
MEAVLTGIIKVVKEIAKAARTARENRKRCLDLADRARIIGDILQFDSSTAGTASSAGGYTYTAKMREPSLKKLKAALEEARELVKSQQQQGGFGDRVKEVATSATTAAEFLRVETLITACVEQQSLPRHTSSRLEILSFRPEESSSQQQRSSSSMTPSSQHHKNLREHQQQRRLQLGDSSLSQQQHNSQSAVQSPQQRRSSRQRQQLISHLASLQQQQSSQPAARRTTVAATTTPDLSAVRGPMISSSWN